MTDPFEAYAAALGTIEALASQMADAETSAQAHGSLQPNSVDSIVATLDRAAQLAQTAKDLKASAMAVIEQVTAGQQGGELVGNTRKIVFEREDREDWDQDALKAHYGAQVPDFVTQKLSVAAKIIKTLPASEQSALQLCRKVTGSKLSIDIEEV